MPLMQSISGRVKNCSVGILPNIMEVKGHACTQHNIHEFAGAVGGSLLKEELMNGAAVFCEVQQLVSAADVIQPFCFAVKQAEDMNREKCICMQAGLCSVTEACWRS